MSTVKMPKPLDPQKEKELLEQMYAGNKDAREELAKHNMRLVVHVAKKYSNYHDNDELISVGSIGLVKAINTYSPEKGTQFATYAAKCIENEILMTWRANKKNLGNKSLYEPVSYDKEGNEVTLIDLISQDEESVIGMVESKCVAEKLMQVVKGQLDDREYQIIAMRYGLEGRTPLTQKQVAKAFGISRSYVSRIETKVLKKLKTYMSKGGITM
jgi:RNA polymerase sporulation-specific sigma factor